ncbi:MAG TPA: hypothetical protein VF127_06765 [Nitrospira sp.]
MTPKPLIVVLLAFLAVGCQSAQTPKPSGDNGSFMGLWSVYSHCQSAKDFEELKHDAVVLNTSAKRTISSDGFVLPLPGKLERLVTTPSARLAVDVKAMSAACSLRAGQAAVEARRFDVAKDLLKGILDYHPQADYAFYTLQAKAILSEIEPESLQVSLNAR